MKNIKSTYNMPGVEVGMDAEQDGQPQVELQWPQRHSHVKGGCGFQGRDTLSPREE